MKTNQMQSGWEVEWAESVKYEPDGAILPDTARYVTRDFHKREDALAFAKNIVAKDVFGSVAVAPFYLEPYEPGLPGSFREYSGETEYVNAD